jgi:hypothetical protein
VVRQQRRWGQDMVLQVPCNMDYRGVGWHMLPISAIVLWRCWLASTFTGTCATTAANRYAPDACAEQLALSVWHVLSSWRAGCV